MELPGYAMQDVGQIAGHNTADLGLDDWTDVLATVNAVELDVWPAANWVVSHNFDVGEDSLDTYLTKLTDWRSKHNGAHPLLTIFIEIKDNEGWRVGDFESILRRHFPDDATLFRPSDLRAWARTIVTDADNKTLRDVVRATGWPSYASLANRVMFVMNCGNNHHVMITYQDEAPKLAQGQTCFGMLEPGDTYGDWEDVVILNEVFASYPTVVNPSDRNILRRAWQVDVGNDELAAGNRQPATDAMTSKKVNFLCYDVITNAFWTQL